MNWDTVFFKGNDSDGDDGESEVCYQVTVDFCNVSSYPTLQSELIFHHITCNKLRPDWHWGGIAASGRCSDDCLNTKYFQESCITTPSHGRGYNDIMPPVTRYLFSIISLGKVLFRTPPLGLVLFPFSQVCSSIIKIVFRFNDALLSLFTC